MQIEFYPRKDAINQKKHKISLEEATEFDWDIAVYVQDKRKIYGEWRMIAIGYIQDRLHVLVYTERCNIIRVISLRKANNREKRFYAAQR
jgi:uncharacterized protein